MGKSIRVEDKSRPSLTPRPSLDDLFGNRPEASGTKPRPGRLMRRVQRFPGAGAPDRLRRRCAGAGSGGTLQADFAWRASGGRRALFLLQEATNGWTTAPCLGDESVPSCQAGPAAAGLYAQRPQAGRAARSASFRSVGGWLLAMQVAAAVESAPAPVRRLPQTTTTFAWQPTTIGLRRPTAARSASAGTGGGHGAGPGARAWPGERTRDSVGHYRGSEDGGDNK
jgi:hypothetical protein